MSRVERRQQERLEAELRHQQRVQKRKKASFLRTLFIVVTIVLIVAIGVGAFAYWYINNKLNQIEEAPGDTSLEEYTDYDLSCVDVNGFINILVLGIDTRDMNELAEWRSDAILIVSIKEKTGEVYLTSIYRDTYLKMEDFEEDDNFYDKITHAFYYGGIKNSIKSINQAMDLDIREYVLFNVLACVDIIDAMGGIELNIDPYEIDELNRVNYETCHMVGITEDADVPKVREPGRQHVDGTLAVSYGRMRDGVGDDYKRTERMRTVVEKILEKAKTLSLSEINKIINLGLPQIKTNLSNSDILGLAFKMLNFNIVGTSGFPYEITDGFLGAASYVFPVDLYEDVSKYHETVFGQASYMPSDKVIEISNHIKEELYGVSDSAEGVSDDWVEPDGAYYYDYDYDYSYDYSDDTYEYTDNNEYTAPDTYYDPEPSYEEEPSYETESIYDSETDDYGQGTE